MKVKLNRHGQTLRRTICARMVCLAGMTLLMTAAPAPAFAQSAGMAHLLHPKGPAARRSGQQSVGTGAQPSATSPQ